MLTQIEEALMPFGKHKGKPLSEVPRTYLCYAACWDAIWPSAKKQIMAEISRRGLPFGLWKEVPLSEVPRGYLNWLKNTFEAQGSGLRPPYDELVARQLALSAPVRSPAAQTASTGISNRRPASKNGWSKKKKKRRL